METSVLNDRQTPLWVRVGSILAIATPQLITGGWAVVEPHHWFDHFPGIGPLLVAAEPPYNAHLASDAGAGFLTAGLAVAVAALLGRRILLIFALGMYAIGVVPHVLYHALNPAPGLSDTENIVNVVMLASGLVAAIVLAWGSWKSTSPAGDP